MKYTGYWSLWAWSGSSRSTTSVLLTTWVEVVMWRSKGSFSSGAVTIGGIVKKSLRFWNAFVTSSFHSNLSVFLGSLGETIVTEPANEPPKSGHAAGESHEVLITGRLHIGSRFIYVSNSCDLYWVSFDSTAAEMKPSNHFIYFVGLSFY